MSKIKGLYQHIDEHGYIRFYFRRFIDYDHDYDSITDEKDILMVQYKDYVMVQYKVYEKGKENKIKIFKNGQICMKGSGYINLNEEEMETELKWCVEQYEKEGIEQIKYSWIDLMNDE